MHPRAPAQPSTGFFGELRSRLRIRAFWAILVMVDNRIARTFHAGKLAFKQTATGLAVVLPGSKRAIAHVVPDTTYPMMWRIRFPDGRLSAMANKPRAKDAALLHAAAILNHQKQGAQPLAAA
jgi:hypothetical protein